MAEWRQTIRQWWGILLFGGMLAMLPGKASATDFTVTIGNASAVESGGAVVFPITVEPAAVFSSGGYDILFSFAAANVTTSPGDVITWTGGHATSTSGLTRSITINDDNIVEGAETFTLTFTINNFTFPGADPSTVTFTAGGDTATGTILPDGDAAVLSLNGPSSVAEGAPAVYTISSSAPIEDSAGLVVNFSADGGTSAEPTDFTVSGSSVTYPTGPAFGVLATDDAIVEEDEQFEMRLDSTNLGAVTIDPGTASVMTTIANGEDTATVTIADVAAAEGDALTFTATLDREVEGGLTLAVAASDASASAGTDYDAALAPAFLVFSGTAGETQSFSAGGLDDAVVEGNETFTVAMNSLTASVPAARIDISDSATGTVQENDTATVTLSPVTEVENNGPMTFVANVDLAVQGGFSVGVDFTDGTALGNGTNLDYDGTTPVTLTFTGAAGESLPFQVNLANDVRVEGDETFTVGFNSASVTALPAQLPFIDTSATAVGTIQDDGDTAVISLIGPTAVSEGDTATYYLESGGIIVDPSAGLTLTITADSLTGDTAELADYANTTGTDIAYSGINTTFTILTNEETKVEADETFTVSLVGTNLPSVITLASSPAEHIQTTILNDDTARVIIYNASALEGGNVTFSARLDREVEDGFTVMVKPTGLSATLDYDFYNDVQKLSFTGTEVLTPLTFYIRTYPDNTNEPNETFRVSMYNPVAVSVDTAALNITDTADGTIFNDDHFLTMTASANGTLASVNRFGSSISVTGGTTQMEVLHNATPTFVATPKTGYTLTWLRVNGTDVPAAAGATAPFSYTLPFQVVNDAVVVEAAFSSMIEIIEVSPFGTVVPHPAGDLIEVQYGDNSPTMNITAHADILDPLGHNGHDHHISNILVDGSPLAGIQGAGLTSYNLDFTNVTVDHSVELLFTSYVDVRVTGPGAVEHNSIQVSNASAGTTVDSIEVESTIDALFNIVPATGYHIASVTVDGADVGRTSTYTFANNVDDDHVMEVQFSLDTFVIEPISTFGTIYNDAAETVAATAQYPSFNGTVTYYVDINHPDHEVQGIVIDGVAVPMPVAGDTTTDINGVYSVTNVGDNYLRVEFLSIKASHRLEALDYVSQEISDVPLAAATISAPPNVMFIFDDSGSMDWDVMIPDSTNQGLYDGYSAVFGSGAIPSSRRMEWKAQWHGYNHLYYNPKVSYEPWPRVVTISENLHNAYPSTYASRLEANADLDYPRYHPLKSNSLFNMNGQFVDKIDYASAKIIDDESTGYSRCSAYYDTTGAGGYNDDYHELRIGVSGCTTAPYATWSTTFSSTVTRNVYVQWQGESDSFQDVCYQVTHAGGTSTICGFDHTVDSGGWVDLGSYTFTSASGGSVRLSSASNPAQSGSEAQADAVMFASGLVIPNAHYYVWSELDNAPYLVVFNSGTSTLDYYRATGTSIDNLDDNHNDVVTVLTFTATPPADVAVTDDYLTARQNFANWVSYYMERRLSAIAAVSRSIVRMERVQVGVLSIWNRVVVPVKRVKVDGEDYTDQILYDLYQMQASGGTPLRRALDFVGQYYDTTNTDTSDNPLRTYTAPWATMEEGGECQQSFAILMTDGYWNDADSTRTSSRSADNDNAAPYQASQSSTIADIAMNYYERDLVTSLDDKVESSPELTLTNDDPASWQHMVTFGVSFGLNGSLNPDDYNMDVTDPSHNFPTWPWVSANAETTIDDMFHASVNGRGDFIAATNPDELVRALVEIVNNISKRSGSEASVSINGDQLFETVSDEVRIYQTSYNTETWRGDVTSSSINTTDSSVNTPPVWSANATLESTLGSDGSGHTGRNIITYNTSSNAGAVFNWANISPVQQKHLFPYFASSLTGEDVLEFVRGSKEFEDSGEFRTRLAALGDFVHSQVRYEDGFLYAGANDGMLHAFYADDAHAGAEVFAYVPSFAYTHLRDLADPTYKERHKYFVDGQITTKKFNDTLTLLVGSLGKGGKGVFALNVADPAAMSASNVLWEYPLPSTNVASGTTITFHDLGALTNDEIRKSDGGLDVFAAGDLITVAGANCSGGTTGSNDGTFEVISATSTVLTIQTGSLINSCGDNDDITIYRATSDPSLGYTFSRPTLIKSNDSSINTGTDMEGYVVVLGNGYASENETASLYLLNPLNGNLIRRIETGVGPLNGLSEPTSVDADFDLKVDYVYAGDLLGNMWKFDLTATRNADWQVAFCDEINPYDSQACNASGAVPQPLFSANNHQPITGGPDIMFHQTDGYMVIFGTGRYLSVEDIENTDIQSLYGIWDWAPDAYDQGYLGSRIDDLSGTDPIATLSHAPLRDAVDDPVNTLLRQEVWVEGEITEDADGDGNLDVAEDSNGNGVLDPGEDIDGDGKLDVEEDIDGDGLDTYSYYRIPTNYKGEWELTQSTFDVTGDSVLDDKDLIPLVNVGWYFDLPGMMAENDNVDNDSDTLVDEVGERAMGERMTNDTIIRDGRAIMVTFGMSGATCRASIYSFLNERDGNTGGMLDSPALDINGDGQVDSDDMVYIYVDPDGDGTFEYIPASPTDLLIKGHAFNPVILSQPDDGGTGGRDRNPEEDKYFGLGDLKIERVREKGERRGVYYWQQVE